jgi:hypothetical protein
MHWIWLDSERCRGYTLCRAWFDKNNISIFSLEIHIIPYHNIAIDTTLEKEIYIFDDWCSCEDMHAVLQEILQIHSTTKYRPT